MSNEVQVAGTLPQLKGMLANEDVKKNLSSMLGSKAQGFATSVLSAVNNNRLLANADPKSIYASAMIAASLDLPINANLGFAALVPYGNSCQFQIQAKGIIQLAIRSGQYQRINNAIVYEGQLVKEDPFTGDYEFDFKAKKSDTIIGYVAYFKTVGGFEKWFYMTKEEVEAHGRKYSKSYSRGVWSTDFNSMALKTVIKLLLSKFGILSIEMQRAIKFDQSRIAGDFNSIEDIDSMDAEYIDNDNEGIEIDKEKAAKVSNAFAKAIKKDAEEAKIIVDEETGEIKKK